MPTSEELRKAEEARRALVAPHDPSDPNACLAGLLYDILFAILGMRDTKPADDRVWQALGRLDSTRRLLQRAAGQEPTRMEDIHSRVVYSPDPPAQE